MPSPRPLSPAVFLDRDGTLMEDVHYCNDPADVRVFPGTREALERLRRAGFKTVIITNQAGIGKGRITPSQYEAVHRRLLDLIGHDNIDATYFCPEPAEANPPRRKPEPAMVLEAARDLGLDLPASFFVGDKAIDVLCGRNAGTRTVLVQTGYGRSAAGCSPDHTAPDFPAAADLILAATRAAP